MQTKIKAGLEIHQQLDTHKLFCTCPSLLRTEKPQFTIERKLNPVVGETGKIDIAAEYEKTKNKKFIYEVYDTNCLVELDEEPPHQINPQALDIAIQIALLFNCKIFPVTQIMRKTVVDGSNTSGFQRTVLIAHDGHIETSEGKVGIETIALEEDAARIISHEDDQSTFRLDRLGIPLVEITTKPDLKSPEQIKEAALKIGEILRAANVKRGIGTIRQDLNISTPSHPRVEIKGFQNPKIMIKTIENEVERQKINVSQSSGRANNKRPKDDKIRDANRVGGVSPPKSHVRKTNPDATTSFLRPMPGAARMYPETDHPLLKISRQIINHAKNNLPKLTSEHRSYLKEFGLNNELIQLLIKEKRMQDFEYLLNIYNNPQLVAKSLTIFSKEIEAKENKKLNIDTLELIFEAVAKNQISENQVKTIMQKIAQGQSLKQAMQKQKINLKEEIQKLIQEKPGLSQGAYMGLIMGKFKGAVNGNEVAEELEKELNK
ncbi:Glu-tRNA(Gln) amidotransferase GatDE subunit E [Candidatus Pacearchaeota archaeon]|nr:Glu-tRNA(Gln) amidotransferase GatDE subunit E [Candidatus Pacearchaeota archaeon]